MILVDANILLYAYISSSEHHTRAAAWLRSAFAAGEPLAFCWPTILAFLRIMTSARVLERPLSGREAISIMSDWVAHPSTVILTPGERHWSIFGGLLERSQARGALVMDAHLAALAIEHGAALCTNDQDFSRFPGLRVTNPFIEQ